MRQYLDLVKEILANGERRADRTGVGTISLFGPQVRYDLREGFPAVTTKRLAWRSAFREILWMMSGSTRIDDLGCGIWDAWAFEDGTIGPGYGLQLRQWGALSDPRWMFGIDQVSQVIGQLREDPNGRRHIISTWNVADLPEMALPPCHGLVIQFYVSDRYLDMKMYQRSADVAIGMPFNIAGYALMQHLIAREVELEPRYLIHTMGDAHVYLNHVDGLREQLAREPRALPRLVLPVGLGIWEIIERRHSLIEEGSIRLDGYDPHPSIKFEVAV